MRADLVILAFLAVSVLSVMSRSRYCSSSAMTSRISSGLAGGLVVLLIVIFKVCLKRLAGRILGKTSIRRIQ
jgi:hypothetical protein